MEKAYDPKALVAKLKGRGLDIAEEGVKILIEETFSWAEESAKISATPFDDLVGAAVLPKVKEIALSAADKIDGKLN